VQEVSPINPFRAKRIANHFSGSPAFQANNRLYGVTIRYMDIQVHFEDEHDLWEFLNSLGEHTDQQGLIKEAAAKLIAWFLCNMEHRLLPAGLDLPL